MRVQPKERNSSETEYEDEMIYGGYDSEAEQPGNSEQNHWYQILNTENLDDVITERCKIYQI